MALKIYPVIKTENQCEDYKVKINGEQVELNTARVSAVPFNRRWPGHQRGIEQTELINFLSCAAEEPFDFEITPKNPFEKIDIIPKTLGIVPKKTDNGTIVFTLESPSYFTVEPFGRNNALHIFADPIANYNIDFKDENVIFFGKGEHEVGEIVFNSNQITFIEMIA